MLPLLLTAEPQTQFLDLGFRSRRPARRQRRRRLGRPSFVPSDHTAAAAASSLCDQDQRCLLSPAAGARQTVSHSTKAPHRVPFPDPSSGSRTRSDDLPKICRFLPHPPLHLVQVMPQIRAQRTNPSRLRPAFMKIL